MQVRMGVAAVALASMLAFAGAAHGAQLTQQAKLVASDGSDGDYMGWTVDASGDYAIAGAIADGERENVGGLGLWSGSAYVFRREGTAWSQEVKLNASDAEAWQLFGTHVSISDKYAVVGNQSGGTYVFARDGATWTEEAKLSALGGGLSIGDDRIMAGARIYAREGAGWDLEAELSPSGGWSTSSTEGSVALAGDCLIMGTPTYNGTGTYSGCASIFALQPDGTWDEVQRLTASDAAAGDRFGTSVAMSGGYAIVGAMRADGAGTDTGAAYIFRLGGDGTWVEEIKLAPADGDASTSFGRSVSLSGGLALIGTAAEESYVFARDDTGWSLASRLTADDGGPGEGFGYDVALGGDYALVGAWGADGLVPGSGAAYVFNIPEPATSALVGVGIAAFVMRRRTRR